MGRVDVATLLGKSELFQAFDPDDMARIVATAGSTRLALRSRVFAEGDPADRMFVVGDGRVAEVRRSPDAKESIVAVLEAGDLLGEMNLFDGAPRPSGARALQACELITVPYAPLARAFAERPTLLRPMVALLARRVRAREAAVNDARFLDVTARTAKMLLELAGGRDEFALPITQEELAGMVGASRERVNKALARFVRLGWLAVHDLRYRIPATRRARAEGRLAACGQPGSLRSQGSRSAASGRCLGNGS